MSVSYYTDGQYIYLCNLSPLLLINHKKELQKIKYLYIFTINFLSV